VPNKGDNIDISGIIIEQSEGALWIEVKSDR